MILILVMGILIPLTSNAKEPIDVDRDCLIKMCGIPWGYPEDLARRKDLYPLDEKAWFKIGNELRKYPGLVPGGRYPGGVTFGKENVKLVFDPSKGFTTCFVKWRASGLQAQQIFHSLRMYFGIVYQMPAMDRYPDSDATRKGRWLLDEKGRYTENLREAWLLIKVDRDSDYVYLEYSRLWKN